MLPFRLFRILAPALLLAFLAGAENDGETDRRRLAYEQHALTHEGDPERGRTVFLDEKTTRCVTCHKVEDRGGDIGPDLSRIGGKFDRPHLIESLLEPSRQIVEGYRAITVVIKDGNVETGILREETADGIVLATADGEKTIAPSRIAGRNESPLSLMPDGLPDLLTRERFTDLIAYLESLRPGGRSTPGSKTRGSVHLPPGFAIDTVATGLTGATALEVAPGGRVLVCEQPGALRVVREGELLERPFLTLPVESYWERGLIGVTVDPGFPETPHVYVCYVAEKPFPHHRVSRFTADGDVARPGSERVLLEGDDQRKLGGNVPAGHQGGALHFGIDGKLYIAIGEQTAGRPAQDLRSFLGKVLRIEPDGGIPPDNPFVEKTEGKYRAIWALGCRNPFTFAVRKSTGELFLNDVGGKSEEINVGEAGANYGWPAVEHGPTSDPRFRGPIHHYPQASISGGDFAPQDLAWPERYRGPYFFADFVHGWVKTLDPADPRDVRTFLTGLRRPVDLRFDGESLWILVRNAWVIDGKFEPGTGSLLRIRHGRLETR